MPAAEQHLWNYLSPDIGALVRNEYLANQAVTDRQHRKLYGYPRLFEDLLSSQPMCFNLFGPLALDLDAATAVARALWPDRVDRVLAVRFEYSPRRWDPRYLDNGTAADVLFDHTTPTGGRGVIAVETKYHENLQGRASTHKTRYDDVAAASGLFLPRRYAGRPPPRRRCNRSGWTTSSPSSLGGPTGSTRHCRLWRTRPPTTLWARPSTGTGPSSPPGKVRSRR